MALSERQTQILKFIKNYLDEYNYPPTIREIGQAIGITSTSVVKYNLNKLERDEYILRDREVSRGLSLNWGKIREGGVLSEDNKFTDRRRQILVADMDEDWRDVISRILIEAGFEVITANQYSTALSTFATTKIGLVISSRRLKDTLDSQDRSGLDLIQQVRSIQADIPVILLDGGLTVSDARLAYQSGVYDVIDKVSFSPQELLSSVYRALGMEDVEQVDEDELVPIMFNIDGNWSANDFVKFLNFVQYSYGFLAVTNEDNFQQFVNYKYDSPTEFWHYFGLIFRQEISALRVRRLVYASPGNINLSGLGEPIKELRELFESLLLIVYKWKNEKANVELRQREIQQKDLEIEEKKLDIERKAKQNMIELRHQENMNELLFYKERLDIIEKGVELLKSTGMDQAEIEEKVIEPLYHHIFGVAHLIEEEKLVLDEAFESR